MSEHSDEEDVPTLVDAGESPAVKSEPKDDSIQHPDISQKVPITIVTGLTLYTRPQTHQLTT